MMTNQPFLILWTDFVYHQIQTQCRYNHGGEENKITFLDTMEWTQQDLK
jgi:hypothetical protein